MDRSTRDDLFPAASIFCNPLVLRTLQNSPFRPFEDSKEIVDYDLRHDPADILFRFAALPEPCPERDYNEFLNWAFNTSGTGEKGVVRRITPPDYSEDIPSFLRSVDSPHDGLTTFVTDLKSRWGELCRAFVDDASLSRHKHRSSLIPLPYPYFVPGGRFRECYYWDTLWVVKGLVVCDMTQSAQNAVRNLMHLVDRIGFVPNGNRIYYLNRSQPPVLTEAVLTIYDTLDNSAARVAWLEEALPALHKEYDWFQKNRSVANVFPDSPEASLHLSVYRVDTQEPRPESFKEDVMTLQSLKDKEGKQRETAGTYDQLFANLASGAESGWDYSSRWFTSPTSTLVDIEASYIVPCCLNSILLKAESDISYFHDVLCQHYMSQATLDGDVEAVDSKIEEHAKQRNLFAEAAKKRKAAMMKLLWNDGHGFWFDYHLKTRKQMETVSCAGLMPVWAGCWEGRWNISDVERFITFIRRTPGLLNPGGLSSTTNDSEEQWDFPNCWPPLVDFAVEALQKLAIKFEGCGAEPLATDIATRFISTGYRGWLKDKQMHEKYDSRVCTGERGTGGEYLPQTGFGWTNGTLLWLLQDYFDLSAKVLEGR